MGAAVTGRHSPGVSIFFIFCTSSQSCPHAGEVGGRQWMSGVKSQFGDVRYDMVTIAGHAVRCPAENTDVRAVPAQ